MISVLNRRRLLKASLSLAGAMCMPVTVLSQTKSQIVRRLRFTPTFSNQLDHALEKQEFWGYLPADIPGKQYLRHIQVSMPHHIEKDLWGHNILRLSFEHFPAYARKLVTLNTEIALESENIPSLFIGNWLGPERYIESDNQQILDLAVRLKGPSDRDTAFAIFNWVRHNLTYAGYIAEDLGALKALQDQRGDCTEYATLVVALARANQIPARMLGGYFVARDTSPRPRDYHNWAELYFEGSWHTVDAQKENWLEPGSQYIAFRVYRDKASNSIGLAHRYQTRGELQINF